MTHARADRELAYVIFRLSLGISIFTHGLTRFGANYEKFILETKNMLASTLLPDWSVNVMAHIIPIMEFSVGGLLILGLFTRWAALAGSVLMIALIFGTSLAQKWEIVGVQMTYVLFYFLIIYLLEYNRYSLDWKLLKANR